MWTDSQFNKRDARWRGRAESQCSKCGGCSVSYFNDVTSSEGKVSSQSVSEGKDEL